jgi:hypothetical protein
VQPVLVLTERSAGIHPSAISSKPLLADADMETASLLAILELVRVAEGLFQLELMAEEHYRQLWEAHRWVELARELISTAQIAFSVAVAAALDLTAHTFLM